MQTRRKSLVVATLLIAALASYADLPRLHLLGAMGDTLNLARVLDPVQHTRMLQQAAALSTQAGELLHDIDDGQRSLALIGEASVIQAIVPTRFELPKLIASDDNQRVSLGELADFQPLTALGGALLRLDLPPPRFQTHWQPPRLQLPFSLSNTHTARAPPLALR